MMDWLQALAGPAGGVALALMLVSYVRYASRQARRVVEGVQGEAHDHCELVDIRSDVMAPNELVATLCVTHDVQLGPEVWQSKMDRELAELEKPKTVAQIHSEFIDTAFIRIEPMLKDTTYSMTQQIRKKLEEDISGYAQPLWEDPRYVPPRRSWSADDFRRWGWEPSFKQSNFDHGAQKYVLPFYRERGERTWSTYKLDFHSEAAAQGWWRSSVSYEHYRKQREAVRGWGAL